MADDPSQNMPRPPSPSSTKSEDNLSVQGNVDAASNRDGLLRTSSRPPSRHRSRLPSRSQSPSRAAEPPSRVRTADNSSVASSQQDRAPTDAFLMDLITPTDSMNNALLEALQGVKRPRDGESDDEPQPKRDKLFDELTELEEELQKTSGSATTAAPAASAASAVHVGRSVHASRGSDVGVRTPVNARPMAIPFRGTSGHTPRQGGRAVAASATPAATAARGQRGLSGTMNSMTLGNDDPRETEDDDSDA